MRPCLLLLLGVAAASPGRSAPPELAPLFRDHAVLQCDKPVPVWGRAKPGQHVRVAFGGQKAETVADKAGRWKLELAPLSATSQGSDLSVSAGETVTVHDVVVGEVWIAAGSSNMELSVAESLAPARPSVPPEQATRLLLLRQFRVPHHATGAPAETTAGDWSPCSAQAVGGFSAVGYGFARELLNRLAVPFGIIQVTWSGAPLSSWRPGTSVGPAPAGDLDPRIASAVYHGMVSPLVPYAVRGVLWYHGEEDVSRASDYASGFPAMIGEWRSAFGQGDLPFLWVQLAGFRPPSNTPPGQWAALRQAQSRALSLPATGQVVAIDQGEPVNPRPRGKAEVIRRLVLIAKNNVYAIPEDCSGPAFLSAQALGPSLRVRFLHAADGLTASGRPLQAFELAGPDGVFHKATAVIDEDSVVVRSPEVRQPTAVRYAWSDYPDANLFNGAGLPAAPFRSN